MLREGAGLAEGRSVGAQGSTGSALAFATFSAALVSLQGPQGEPGPPGQQGNPGAQVRGKTPFPWVGKRNDSSE